VEDTWTSRDLPVLDAAVSLLDRPDHFAVSVSEIAGHTGIEPAGVAAALDALESDGYVEVDRLMSAGDPAWEVRQVNGAARRAVGQWPTAESLVARLAEGFAAAADDEADPARKNVLRKFAEMLGGAGRAIAVDVAARIVERQAGLG
jgi:predicted ArsR family transcriptional regulator